MKKDFRKWALMVLTTLLLISQPVKTMAQEETARTNQLWLFWQHNQYFTSRLKYVGDIGYRHEIPFEHWRRIHFRPGVQWSAGNLVDLAGGIGFFFTAQEALPNSIEIRPWQGVRLHWPSLGRFYFDHYLRLEQRFNYFRDFDGNWEFAMRSKFKMNVTFPINNPGIIDKTLYARLNAELYFDLGNSIIERFVNKGRLTTGLMYCLNLKWRLEMLYAIEQSTAFSQEGFNVNSHIIQIHLKSYIFRES